MRTPETSITQILSPDKNYCVCLFGLPTPQGEPLRLTFTLYRNFNGDKQALFELPKEFYCADGDDCILWDFSSTAITYTVNHFKRIFIYDFIFQIKKEFTVPDPPTQKSYWDSIRSSWILKSPKEINEFSISYARADIQDFVTFPWRNTQIELSNNPLKECNHHPLYKVFFVSTNQDFRYAEMNDTYFVYNPTLITISKDGQARIPVCNASLTELSCLICDLPQLGQGNLFIIKHEDPSLSPVSLPIKALPQDQSPFYSVRQDCKGLGESGLTEYLALEFINKQTGKVHYSYYRRKDSDGLWNNDRTKFFFDGSEEMMDEDDFCFSNQRDYDVFVVLDVKNRTCIKEYRGSALHPRWNGEGTDVIFDNKLELLEVVKGRKAEKDRILKEKAEKERAIRKEEERIRKEEEALYPKVIPQATPFYILPSPDGIHCIYLKLIQQKNQYRPCLYDVSIIDKKSNVILATGFRHPVKGPDPIRQLNNGKVTFYTDDFSIISFNLNDLYNHKFLTVSIRPIPVQPKYVWTVNPARPEDGKWEAIIDGRPFAPGRFYYDHLHYEDFFKVPILHFKRFRGPLLGDFNYETSNRYETRQKDKGLDKFGMPTKGKLEFVNKSNGQTHLEIAFDMDQRFEGNDPVEHLVFQGWNRRGTKFFFSGYAQPRFEFSDSKVIENHFGHLIVVIDVKDKDIIGIYKYKPTCLPYWDFFGKIQFSEPAEVHQECLTEALTRLHNPQALQASSITPDKKLSVCAVIAPEHPNWYQVCVMDTDQKHVFARIDPYRLGSRYAVRQSGDTGCFYGIVPGSSDSYIIHFNLKDVYTEKELVLSVWNLHTHVDNYVWDSEKSRWYPVIDGKEIHPAPFYYDDQYTECVPVNSTI